MSSGTDHNHSRPLLPIICGPTAVGKTALAVALAARFDVEVVSADSRQVYRQMDIGTAKPTAEEQAAVSHHLVDVACPDEDFDASRYIELAQAAIGDICDRQKHPILVGGTGLYIKALTEGLISAPGADAAIRLRLHEQAEREGRPALHQKLQLVDPESAQRLHPNDLVRTVRALEVYELSGKTLSEYQKAHAFSEKPYRTLKVGLDQDRELLYKRIDARAVAMFDGGLLEETEQLLAAGYAPRLKALKTIGYRQAVAVLRGDISRDKAIEDLQQATRRYAKQQLTWFRQEKSIIWVDSCANFAKILKLIEVFYGS